MRQFGKIPECLLTDLSDFRYFHLRRRDGRAVECTGLENRQGGDTFQGSNPCLSATPLLTMPFLIIFYYF